MKRASKATRLERLRRLRSMNAPRWIIRSEQVALLLQREGLRFAGIGKPCSKRQGELVEKFVTPHMGD